jgi:hypothetical protein
MDTTLVTVTVLSMGMAAALSAIVWRMLRLERHRSNARVVALTAAVRDRTPHTRREVDLPIRPAFTEASAGRHGVADTSTAGNQTPAAPMFVEHEQASPWGARVAVMAAVALAGASFVLFSLAARAQSSARRAAPATAAAYSAPARPAAPAQAGLELMSLHDARANGLLTISGLVQNPRSGTPLSRVTVTVYTFDDTGALLASGHALVDVTALQPGDESPFVVTVPVTEAVARYRIGFRDESGRVIAHIDRRQQGPLASNW